MNDSKCLAQAPIETVNKKVCDLNSLSSECIEIALMIKGKLFGNDPRKESNEKCDREPCIDSVIDLTDEKLRGLRDLLESINNRL